MHLQTRPEAGIPRVSGVSLVLGDEIEGSQENKGIWKKGEGRSKSCYDIFRFLFIFPQLMP
jgi:hypothetical protein